MSTHETSLLEIANEIKKVNDYLIETYNETDAYVIMDIMKNLKSYLARTNELYANAEYLLNVEKGIESEKIGEKISATRYKDVLASKTARYQKVMRYVERTNASIVHIIELLRSQLSFLKAEYKP